MILKDYALFTTKQFVQLNDRIFLWVIANRTVGTLGIALVPHAGNWETRLRISVLHRDMLGYWYIFENCLGVECEFAEVVVHTSEHIAILL